MANLIPTQPSPHTHTAMEAVSKSPPKQHTRKRSLPGPHEPREKRRARNAAVATENAVVAVSMHPPRTATNCKLVWRQLGDGQPDAIASSSASDVWSSAAGSTPAISAAMVHVCGKCHKRFRCPGKLAQHARVHTSDTPFQCSICPKGFSSQSKATRHERAHTSEKPYACSMCPRRFARKGDVPPHERTHTGEKPYACSMCPRRFSDKGDVPRHERTHTGERPYACSTCPRRFANQSNLVRHERTHTVD